MQLFGYDNQTNLFQLYYSSYSQFRFLIICNILIHNNPQSMKTYIWIR